MNVYIDKEWIRIGDFASKRGLVTHLFLHHDNMRYTYDGTSKQSIPVPVNLWTLRAAVKNTSSVFSCATFDNVDEASALLADALRLLAGGE